MVCDRCHVDLAVVIAGIALLSAHHDHWVEVIRVIYIVVFILGVVVH